MTQAEPLDTADLDALLELEQHPGYTLLTDRIWQTIESKRNDLERVKGKTWAARLQGEIAGLRLALNIPGILKDEAKAVIKEQP